MGRFFENCDYKPVRIRAQVYKALVFFLTLCLCISMLPAFAMAADLDLEKDLQNKLSQSRKTIKIVHEKQKSGAASTIDGKRVQGLIEMANIAGHASDPLDPKFEETLMELSHEMMHRWGAYLKFKTDPYDPNSPVSEALLGKDNAHWSYLFDTNGSTLYGNHWQDNGDGPFTMMQEAARSEAAFVEA